MTVSSDSYPMLTFVGSSDAFNAAGRGHSCYLLDLPNDQTVMIDCGATALLGLRSINRQPKEISTILITHLHGDHIGGLPFVILDGMYNDIRAEALRIIGPTGTQRRIDQLMQATYGNLAANRPFEVDVQEIEPNTQLDYQGLQISAYAAQHMRLPDQALCLRIRLATGYVISFSGDTEMCDELLNAARGANLLVAECTRVSAPAGRHCTWQDWIQILPALDSSTRIILTHLGSDVRAATEGLLASVPPGYQIGFADDGMRVQLA